MSEIDEKKLENLAKLGRIELNESEKLKLLKDLPEILNHFQELQKIDTTNVEPMSGGVSQENIFPEDGESARLSLSADRQEASGVKLTDAFPEKENDFLKIPPVFE
ncbi:MAG: Asp-tRNA(Asn)/Glu-tRNA(Gln) amidotransferase subunit GatC [Patescibacteria group bacterium]